MQEHVPPPQIRPRCGEWPFCWNTHSRLISVSISLLCMRDGNLPFAAFFGALSYLCFYLSILKAKKRERERERERETERERERKACDHP